MFKGIAVLAGALFAVGSLSATTPAQAAEVPFSQCASGWFCVWTHPSGTTPNAGEKRMAFQEGARNLAEHALMNDTISAVYNRSNFVFCLYEHSKGDGRKLPISVDYKSKIPDKYKFDNITSSIGKSTSAGFCDGDVPGSD